MPHNFIKIKAFSPNPGKRTRAEVEPVVRLHHGTYENMWFDDDQSPNHAYVLVKDGDVDGMMQDLHGSQVIRLWQAD